MKYTQRLHAAHSLAIPRSRVAKSFNGLENLASGKDFMSSWLRFIYLSVIQRKSPALMAQTSFPICQRLTSNSSLSLSFVQHVLFFCATLPDNWLASCCIDAC